MSASIDRPLLGGVVGGLTLLAIGWTGLLVPSLVRSIRDTFEVDDAGIGIVYLVYAIAYAAGSFGGGPATERIGRRTVLVGAALVHGLGIVSMGLAPGFGAFVLVASLAGVGAGSLDGGVNGLVLDLYRTGRGRAMNLLHLCFSVGALSAPLVIGGLIEAGVAWPAIIVASGLALLPLAVAYAIIPMPSGRSVSTATAAPAATAATATMAPAALPTGDRRRLLAGPIVWLAVAIACYVASEVGVSSWLVRFLEPAPIREATLALSLYWGGLAVGRLVSSVISDRFDHLRFTVACAVGLAMALLGAILVPSLGWSVALFALAGIASGPIFPMILALGGERRPERAAAVGGTLTGMAVVGSVVYPPTMGFLSVTIGLTAAMLGAVIFALVAAAALVVSGRSSEAGQAGPAS